MFVCQQNPGNVFLPDVVLSCVSGSSHLDISVSWYIVFSTCVTVCWRVRWRSGDSPVSSHVEVTTSAKTHCVPERDAFETAHQGVSKCVWRCPEPGWYQLVSSGIDHLVSGGLCHLVDRISSQVRRLQTSIFWSWLVFLGLIWRI